MGLNIICRVSDSAQLVLSIASSRPTSSEIETWKKMVRELIDEAFCGSRVDLVTVTPQSWSLGRELPRPHSTVIEGEKFLFNLGIDVDTEVLDEISGSEEFERGLLWIVSNSNNGKDRLERTVSEIIQNEKTDSEVILLEGDGNVLIWLNPQFTTAEVKSLLHQLEDTIAGIDDIKLTEGSGECL